MPELTLVGSGRRMEIFKEVGRPDQVAKRFGLETMAGTHAIGHTRMATESADHDRRRASFHDRG